MANGYFITGTDTECGKTEITLGLMQLLQSAGHRVLGMKPIASGALPEGGSLQNDDAQRILRQASDYVEYDLVNPYAFEPPIAPHIAAGQAGVKISFQAILECHAKLTDRADMVVVEGVGGWRVPLCEDGAVSDLAKTLDLPVIMVVGMRLGCINHALLTAESIQASGVTLAGWVANMMDPEMLEQDTNLDTLVQEIKAPFMGVVPHLPQPTAEAIATMLRLP